MCSLIGIVRKKGNVIGNLTALLGAENHRGQQACGVAVYNNGATRFFRDKGLVSEVFGQRNQRMCAKLTGSSGIGHTLYSTIGNGTETKQPQMIQPISFNFQGCEGAIGLNGNLIRLEALRQEAKRAGYKFKSKTSDTEVIAALISISKQRDFFDALVEVLKKIEGKGAFSLVILYRDKVYGARDQNGIRPLCMGKKNGDTTDSFILASESCVFPTVKATRLIREIQPGELIMLGGNGVEKSFKWTEKTECKFCVVELVYLANLASIFFGRTVYAYRKMAAKITAQEHPVAADVVEPIPNSGRAYALAFAKEAKIPYEEGLVKTTVVRTFITTRDQDRGGKQRPNLQALADVTEGKDVCGVEDSVYRASVSTSVSSITRMHGKATQFHLRVCSPPVRHRCHLGIDTPTKKELIACHRSVEQIRRKIGCDSLGYLSLAGMKKALAMIGLNPDNYCYGCFNGKYPVAPPKEEK